MSLNRKRRARVPERQPRSAGPPPDAPRSVPVGKQKTITHPWWAMGAYELLATVPVHTQFHMGNVAHPGEPAFRNSNPWPVKIREIRWMSLRPSSVEFNSLSRISWKFKTDRQQDLITRFIPTPAFNTETDITIHLTSESDTFILPAPLFLPAGNTFHMNFYVYNAEVSGLLLDVSLRGRDARTDAPIVINKTVTLGTVVNGYVPVAFDDNQDAQLRDIWIDDIAFGMVTAIPVTFDPFQIIGVDFLPPNDVRWARVEGTPLRLLTSHIPIEWTGAAQYTWPVVHRPKRPYLLEPGDILTMEGATQYSPAAVDAQILAICRGTQEVPND